MILCHSAGAPSFRVCSIPPRPRGGRKNGPRGYRWEELLSAGHPPPRHHPLVASRGCARRDRCFPPRCAAGNRRNRPAAAIRRPCGLLRTGGVRTASWDRLPRRDRPAMCLRGKWNRLLPRPRRPDATAPTRVVIARAYRRACLGRTTPLLPRAKAAQGKHPAFAGTSPRHQYTLRRLGPTPRAFTLCNPSPRGFIHAL